MTSPDDPDKGDRVLDYQIQKMREAEDDWLHNEAPEEQQPEQGEREHPDHEHERRSE